MRHADMKIEWFVLYKRSPETETLEIFGKSSTRERADKGRKGQIARFMRSNTWGGTFVIVDSGVRDVA